MKLAFFPIRSRHLLHFSQAGPSFFLVSLLLLASCTQDAPPAALTLEQIPTAMKQAFARAPEAHQELVTRALSSLQDKELDKAYLVIEGLCAIPDLPERRRQVATAAMLALNQALQDAQARGDQKAAEFLSARQKFK